MINILAVVTDLSGFDSTVYFIPIILTIIGILAIVTHIGLFEIVTGFFNILFGSIIISNPYVIVNTSFLSNGTMLVARTDFFMTPYLEMIFILFGVILLVLGSMDYRKARAK